MAKYTEIYFDYVKGGGEIPSTFNQIEGFKDLFEAYYGDKEIGFETPYLFGIKLEMKANLVIPFYKQKLDILNETYTALASNSRTISENSDRTFIGGARKGKTTNFPLNAQTNTPTGITEDDSYTDSDASLNGRTEDYTASDLLMKLEALKRKENSLLESLLEEFKDLFMKVY